jgi:hypothetical protein
MNYLTEQVFVNIINKQMAMPANSVWIGNQNRKIPNDDGLYIAVTMVDAQVMSSTVSQIQVDVTPSDVVTDWDTPGATWDEVGQTWDQPKVYQQRELSQVIQRENIQIDLFSRSNYGLSRRWEVVAAVQSIYGQQQQEANYCKIFRIPRSFINTSSAEGGSMLNRYSITIPCFVWYSKTRVLTEDGYDYYDDFTTRVDDENSIGTANGIIEFRITGDTIT